MAGLAAEGLILLLIALAQALHNLAVDLVEIGIRAVDGLPLIELVEGLGHADLGGVAGLHVIPLLKLKVVLLVDAPGGLEEGVPIELDAVLLLDEGDGLLHDLPREGQGELVVVVDHGERGLVVGQADAAALEHRGGLRRVAGHIGGDERLAHQREGVVEGDAGLRRAARAHVRRQAEGLGHVDVIGLDVLVHVADDEFRQRLQRHGVQSWEAGHEQLRQHLVHGDKLLALRLAGAETAVMREDVSDAAGEAADDGVHLRVRDAQLLAAVALEQAVDEHEGAEVRTHPAIFPKALHDGHRRGADHLHHGQDVV